MRIAVVGVTGAVARVASAIVISPVTINPITTRLKVQMPGGRILPVRRTKTRNPSVAGLRVPVARVVVVVVIVIVNARVKINQIRPIKQPLKANPRRIALTIMPAMRTRMRNPVVSAGLVRIVNQQRIKIHRQAGIQIPIRSQRSAEMPARKTGPMWMAM